MSINIYCEECGNEMDADDIVCRECYDKLKEEFDELQETVDEQGNQIKKLEDEINKLL